MLFWKAAAEILKADIRTGLTNIREAGNGRPRNVAEDRFQCRAVILAMLDLRIFELYCLVCYLTTYFMAHKLLNENIPLDCSCLHFTQNQYKTNFKQRFIDIKIYHCHYFLKILLLEYRICLHYICQV
jgi:hypothetical protein